MKLLAYEDLKARGIVNNRTTLGRWIRDLGFPAGVMLGPNSRRWPEHEVEAFINTRAGVTIEDPANRAA